MTNLFKVLIPIFMMCFILAYLPGCKDSPTDVRSGFVTSDNDGNFSLTDINGKVWDITHAVNEYGFDPQVFDHGIGAFNFTPIDNPPFLCPGDTNYPADADFLVIGASIDGDTRAYPISVLAPREISNDVFGSAHVSVGY